MMTGVRCANDFADSGLIETFVSFVSLQNFEM